jgi:hypothetical protein
MADPIDGSSGMSIVNIATPLRQPVRDGSPRAHTKDFIQLLKPAKKKYIY